MNTKAAFIFLLLLLANCLSAQPTKQNGWQILSLKGKVKALTETLVSSEDTIPHRMRSYISAYKFNEQGYITEDTRIPLKGNGKEMIATKEYDASNNYTKITYDKYVSTFKNEYDANNNLIKQTEYDSLKQIKSIDSFTYNNAGNVLEKDYFNTKDSLPERTIITYDSKLAATHKKYSKTGYLRHVTQYASNMSNNIVWERMYESDGTTYQTWKFKYDNNGNRIGIHSYGRMEDSKHTLTFNEHNDQLTNTVIIYKPTKAIYKYTSVYEYDEHGNWTSLIVFKESEKLRTITRQLTYY